MNSLPPQERGAGAGMTTTFQNSATVLSIGIFFSVVTLGLASSLPGHLYAGLTAQGVPSGGGHPDRVISLRSASCSPASSATTPSSSCSVPPACCSTSPPTR